MQRPKTRYGHSRVFQIPIFDPPDFTVLENITDTSLVRIEVLDRDDQVHQLDLPADVGLNVMEACKANDLPILGTCGGMALCGSCHVYVLSDHDIYDRSHEEEAMLDQLHCTEDNSRLCCQIRVDHYVDGLKIKLAPE